MKISELMLSDDVETFLLGLRILPEDFYEWCKKAGSYTTCHTVSIAVNVCRIRQILQSNKVSFENLSGEILIHYRDVDLYRFCYRNTLVNIVKEYENFRINSSL